MAAVAEKDKVVKQPQTSTPEKKAPAKKPSTVSVQSGASPTSKKPLQAGGDAANKAAEKKAVAPKNATATPSSSQSGEAASSIKPTSPVDANNKTAEKKASATPKKAPAAPSSSQSGEAASGIKPTSVDANNKAAEKKASATPKKAPAAPSSSQSGEAPPSIKSTSGGDVASTKENNNKQPTATKTPAEKPSTPSPSTASNESNDVDSSGNNGNSENRPRRRRFNHSNSNRQGYVPYSVLLKRHEEEQKAKKILASNITGTVKWFSLRYHYGFIARDDGQGDVFVHQMNIAKSRMNRVYLRSLAHNEKVEFDVVEGKSGPEASNVTGPGNTEVQGVYIIQLRFPVRRRNDGNMGLGNRRHRNTSGNDRRQRRRTENEDNDDSPQAPPRRNRRNRGNRNRTISGNKVEEKLVNALAENVGSVQVAN